MLDCLLFNKYDTKIYNINYKIPYLNEKQQVLLDFIHTFKIDVDKFSIHIFYIPLTKYVI